MCPMLTTGAGDNKLSTPQVSSESEKYLYAVDNDVKTRANNDDTC